MNHDRNEKLIRYFSYCRKYPEATLTHHKRRRKILNLATHSKKGDLQNAG